MGTAAPALEPPGGLVYRPDFLTTGEEAELLASCTMRFRYGAGGARRTFAMEIAPRSAYVLAGAARWSWQHSIASTPELRYSITRTVREPAGQS